MNNSITSPSQTQSTKAFQIVLRHSKSRGHARLMMACVALYFDMHKLWPQRHELIPMVNESRRQCDKLIDYCVALGELNIIPAGHPEAQALDEIASNWLWERMSALHGEY